jgi:hypothetical protein
VSKRAITTITDRVMDGMAEWQNRPLDPAWLPLIVVTFVQHERVVREDLVRLGPALPRDPGGVKLDSVGGQVRAAHTLSPASTPERADARVWV